MPIETPNHIQVQKEFLVSAKFPLRFTKYILIFIAVYLFLFQGFWRGWWPGDHPFKYDRAHYYSYLPTILINKNFDFSNCPGATETPLGRKVPKVTYGMALMYSPFFVLGHKMAINTKSPLTGFSEPYSTWIHYGSFIYILGGLYMLACVMRRFLPDPLIATTIACLFFGTNIFHYTVCEGEMAHVYCLFLITAIMLLSCKWHENKKNSTLLLLGLITGLLTLIRPTEILILLFFLFYEVNSFRSMLEKIKLLFTKHFVGLIIFAAAVFIMWVPQMIFWKKLTGTFLFFSYGDSERFFWLDPKIMDVLFSYRKGLFIYTPILIFSILGLFFMRGSLRGVRTGSILYFLINVYLVSAWWCWWYGGGFGMRALIQSYAMLAIPFASFLQYVFALDYPKYYVNSIVRYVTVLALSTFVVLNLVQTYQYQIKSLIHYDSMTREAYWYAFDKFYYVNGEDEQQHKALMAAPDYEAAMKGQRD